MPHVHRARFPLVFERHVLGIDREAATRGRRPTARRTGAGDERVDRSIRDEGALAREGGVKPPRGAEPRVLGRRGQRAERADDALAGALRGRDRFDEEIILVCLVADAPGGATEIHATGRVSLSAGDRQVKSAE